MTPPPRHFFGPEYDGVSGISGDGVSAHAAAHRFPTELFSLFSTRGTVTNSPLPPSDPPDSFRWQVARDQTFTLLEPANVSVPMFLKGMLSLGGTAAANLAQVDARVEIYDSSNTSQLVVTRNFFRFGATHGLGVFPVDTFDHATALLPAGAYRVRATIEISASGGSISSPPGASATVDFFTNPIDGLGASIYAVPPGLTSSRDAVKAVAARSLLPGGLSGAGVEVGIFEPGNPYTTHTSLAGRITLANGASGTPPFDDEHTLAVAGIIASADANSANAGVAPGTTIRSAAGASHGTATASF